MGTRLWLGTEIQVLMTYLQGDWALVLCEGDWALVLWEPRSIEGYSRAVWLRPGPDEETWVFPWRMAKERSVILSACFPGFDILNLVPCVCP